MAYKSPGVYNEEISVVYAKRTPNAIRACFAGNFQKGPVGEAIAITELKEFIQHFGYPTDKNYNDWFQVERFLRYFPGIYVTRAANLEHTFDACATFNANITVTVDKEIKSFELSGDNPYGLKESEINKLRKLFRPYDKFTIEGDNADNGAIYTIMDVENFEFVPKLRWDVFQGQQIMRLSGVVNASIEMPTQAQFDRTPTHSPNGIPANEPFIESADAFSLYKDSFASNNTSTPLTIWARSPGAWGNGIQVAIVKPEDFKVNYSASDTRSAKMAFDGIIVDHAFRQAPHQGQFGILVALDGKVVESFIVGPNRTSNNFIEDEINTKSAYIFVKRGIGELYSTAFSNSDIKRPLTLLGGRDAEVSIDDLNKAYDIFKNKDIFKPDVIIANELDGGLRAKNLAIQRQDLTSICGASLNLFAHRDPAKTVDNLVDWRTHMFIVDGCACPSNETTLNAQVFQSSFCVYVGNYGIIHDPYNNKMRMINLAGDIAGLRCETNSKYGEWKASAGINRGKLKDGLKLLFNPDEPHRDIMYSNNINPVIAMSEVGNVLWGNRTMASLDDNFLPWHVRSMVNMLIRNCNSMLKAYVMDNITPYTLHAAKSSLSPLFDTVKTGGGLTDYYIKCDNQNNTDETMANQELYVDLYIKPTGVAEFICIRLVNTGSETIATLIEREQLKRV